MTAIRYRILEPTIAISYDEGKGVAHTVNAGTIVEVNHGAIDGNKLVEVTWNGRVLMMFTQDLRQRAQEVE